MAELTKLGKTFVSATLAWCFADEQTPQVLSVLERHKAGERAVVPALWSLEVLNCLLVGEVRTSAEEALAFLVDLSVTDNSWLSLSRTAGQERLADMVQNGFQAWKPFHDRSGDQQSSIQSQNPGLLDWMALLVSYEQYGKAVIERGKYGTR